MSDLANDPNNFILDLNHGQTFTTKMLKQPVQLIFGDNVAPSGISATITAQRKVYCKGVAVFSGHRIVSYHSGMRSWEKIVELMDDEHVAELSPAPDAFPFITRSTHHPSTTLLQMHGELQNMWPSNTQ